jgi:hypothetical protein
LFVLAACGLLVVVHSIIPSTTPIPL